ncbi:MAG: rhamnulokinase [Ruminococcaceae bacterium]|nr:rhamnulokinase [Oscillospiraceae bacterium]
MAEKKMLAIDLGASSGRGIVGSFDGEKLSLKENHRFSNDPVIVNGRMHWDILRIFHEIKQSITKTVLEKDDVRSIGIDTWGVDYALLDKHGRMLSNPVHYRDTRTDGVVPYIGRFFSQSELYGVTGIQCMNFNTIFQLATELRDDPTGLERAERMLNIPDLLNYFLTGKMANEYTILSTGALLDAKERTYAYSMIDKVGLPRRLFGDIVQPGHCLGGLLPQVLEETGKTDAKVLNVASHDTASAVIAVPTQEDDFLFISSGTWSLMGTELRAPMINEATAKYDFTNEGGACGTIRFLKNIMGLWLIQESRRQWRREGSEYSFAQLEALAKECKPFKCFINPDDASFATPGNLPERIREYCRRTGQQVPESVGEVVRCIYESLALKYRYTAESINTLTGLNARVIYVVGGGTKDGFLSQMTADATGMPVSAGPEEATAIGNLMMQMMTAGDAKDLKDARRIVAASFDRKHYDPTTDRAPWDEAFARFCALN